MRKRLPGSTGGAKKTARAALILAVLLGALSGGAAAAAEKAVPFWERDGSILITVDDSGAVSVSGGAMPALQEPAGGLLVAAAARAAQSGAQPAAQPGAQASAGQSAQTAQTAPSAASTASGAPKQGTTPPPTVERLFGSNTVEFRGLLQKKMPRWQRVIAAEKRSPTFDGDLSKLMRPSLYKDWQKLVANHANTSDVEKAKAVTVFFNRWQYRYDIDVYKVSDYWATPREFLKNSGDCEDYAITKFYAMIKLGVDPAKMRVVVVMDTILNVGHAILVLYADDTAYVMDNQNTMLLPHTDRRTHRYDPKNSINLVYFWAHVKAKKTK